eukprot:scaffold1427_cov182-Amphora_coffeaeformis.AAC.1
MSSRRKQTRKQGTNPSRPDGSVIPTTLDVILGRGVLFAAHPGNARYYELVDACIEDYRAAATKTAKGRIVKQVYQQVTEYGRFVRKEGGAEAFYEISAQEARTKIGHAIRFRKRKLDEARRIAEMGARGGESSSPATGDSSSAEDHSVEGAAGRSGSAGSDSNEFYPLAEQQLGPGDQSSHAQHLPLLTEQSQIPVVYQQQQQQNSFQVHYYPSPQAAAQYAESMQAQSQAQPWLRDQEEAQVSYPPQVQQPFLPLHPPTEQSQLHGAVQGLMQDQASSLFASNDQVAAQMMQLYGMTEESKEYSDQNLETCQVQQQMAYLYGPDESNEFGAAGSTQSSQARSTKPIQRTDQSQNDGSRGSSSMDEDSLGQSPEETSSSSRDGPSSNDAQSSRLGVDSQPSGSEGSLTSRTNWGLGHLSSNQSSLFSEGELDSVIGARSRVRSGSGGNSGENPGDLSSQSDEPRDSEDS